MLSPSPPSSSEAEDVGSTSLSFPFHSNCDNNETDPDTETSINADQVQFLEGMLSQYDSLVKDMGAKLRENAQDLTSFFHLQSFGGESENDGQNELLNLQNHISRLNALIQNLEMQRSVLSSAKSVSQKLWATTLNRVEQLESDKLGQDTRIDVDLGPKWVVLTEYATALEEQVVRLMQDLYLHKLKLAEVCEREEKVVTVIRSENTVKSLKIEELTSELEKWEQKFNLRLKERVEKERVNWEYRQGQGLRLVRVEVEELLLENATHQKRESQLVIHVSRLEQQILEQRSKMEMMATISEANQQLRESLLLKESLRAPILPAAPIPIIIEKTATSSLVVKVEVSTQTRVLSPRILAVKDQGYADIKDPIISRNSFLQLHRQNTEMQAGALEKVKMLQNRIHELEELNTSLTKQFQELNDKHETILDKQNDDNYNKIVKTEKHGWIKEEDVDDWKEKCRAVNDKRKDIQILRLSQQLQQFRQRESKLLEVIEEEVRIGEKWKLEYKQLAKSTLSSLKD